MFDWEEQPDLNITPLVDVMLVLMAILMVTAPVFVYQEKIVLPDGSKTEQVLKHEPMEITIFQDRKIMLNGKRSDWETFPAFFRAQTVKSDRQSTVLIKGDGRLNYDDIMHILALVKQHGFTKISLATHG